MRRPASDGFVAELAGLMRSCLIRRVSRSDYRCAVCALRPGSNFVVGQFSDVFGVEGFVQVLGPLVAFRPGGWAQSTCMRRGPSGSGRGMLLLPLVGR